jgi:hypothetical protein
MSRNNKRESRYISGVTLINPTANGAIEDIDVFKSAYVEQRIFKVMATNTGGIVVRCAGPTMQTLDYASQGWFQDPDGNVKLKVLYFCVVPTKNRELGRQLAEEAHYRYGTFYTSAQVKHRVVVVQQ